MRRFILFVGMLLLLPAYPLKAQYPTVPDSVKQLAEQENKIYEELDKKAWEQALKIVQKEEKKEGSVYSHWAK
ncbi:MAG: hypothetical protein LUI04_06820, partial [Porphyromonadaceae bacterium]|nr:hypothetical protein [Porphyromonadaceae bacterium]